MYKTVRRLKLNNSFLSLFKAIQQHGTTKMQKIIIVIVAVIALACAQGGGGEDHKRATSYADLKRLDGKSHEVHIKAHPEYKYGFDVSDDKHHDYKTKHEEREGYKVKGSYTLVEPDGKTVRRVDYTSDKKEGFNAKVTYQKHN